MIIKKRLLRTRSRGSLQWLSPRAFCLVSASGFSVRTAWGFGITRSCQWLLFCKLFSEKILLII